MVTKEEGKEVVGFALQTVAAVLRTMGVSRMRKSSWSDVDGGAFWQDSTVNNVSAFIWEFCSGKRVAKKIFLIMHSMAA